MGGEAKGGGDNFWLKFSKGKNLGGNYEVTPFSKGDIAWCFGKADQSNLSGCGSILESVIVKLQSSRFGECVNFF